MNDMIGQRFGRLTVTSRAQAPEGYTKRDAWWHCKCDCGGECDITTNRLTSRKEPSCGCYAREVHALVAKKKRKIIDDRDYVRMYTRRLMVANVCPECRKTFERIPGEWGYMIDGARYCSYKCMRAAERAADEKRRKANARKRKNPED